ncbi:MAG: sodium ion-translocating decarboxylase subunit beta, partial [Armatimonadota bacterium]
MNGACGALRNWVALQQDVYAPGVSLANSTNCGNGFTNGSVIASLGYEFYQAALNDSSSPSPTATLATTANLNYNALSSAQMKTLNGLVVSSLLPSGMSVATAASDLSMSDAASAYQPNMGLSPYADGPTTLQAQIKNIRNGIQSEMTTPIGDCSTGASSNTTSLLLACAYQAFITNDLPQQGTAYGSNVITLIADWNQYVMSVYQQNLIALTYLYDVEAISNYMNFYQWNQYLTAQICLMTSPPSWATCPASPGPSTAVPFQQINPWETLPVSFSVGSAIGQTPPKSLGMSCTGSTPSVSTCTINANSNSSSQNPLTLTQTSFLQAQQNLAVLYAQRVNYLYQGVLKGIFPPLIFLGIGAMTDFSPLISNPKLILLGGAALLWMYFSVFMPYSSKKIVAA